MYSARKGPFFAGFFDDVPFDSHSQNYNLLEIQQPNTFIFPTLLPSTPFITTTPITPSLS
jgi:hypothetical protein